MKLPPVCMYCVEAMSDGKAGLVCKPSEPFVFASREEAERLARAVGGRVVGMTATRALPPMLSGADGRIARPALPDEPYIGSDHAN